MAYASATKGMFDLANIFRRHMFGVSNLLRRRKADLSISSQPVVHVFGEARWGWMRPRSWPLAARMPIVAGALILVVAVAVSRVMMSFVAHEQELAVRQIAAVYLDGIATTAYPHVLAQDLGNTVEALRRSMWFHQGMREQRAVVRLPDGTVFADVSGPNDHVESDDPLHDAAGNAR